MLPPDDLPKIPGYDVIELIDAGGFSRVYRAIQRRFDRAVAIKVLNAGFTDERQRRAFERECKVMGQLSSHPNIVTVYDSATAEFPGGHGLPAIVMELYTGTYRNAGRLSVPEVVDVGVKIADALDHIHRQQIVHRDLKPHNLFISQHGEPAIADFGISTIGGEHTSGARFTLKYAPPELLREGVSDAAGDVYSLGATLYQLATGAAPFDGPSEAEIVRQAMVAEPPPLERSEAPPGLERIIRRCLAKHPGERPTAADVAEAFRRVQAEVGLPGRREYGAATRLPGAQAVAAPSRDGTVGRGTAERHRPATGDGSGRAITSAPADDTDGAFVRPTPGRRPEAPAGTDDSAPPTARARRGVAIGAGVAVLAVGLAALGIALTSGGGDDDTVATTAPEPRDPPAYEVLAAPTELAVQPTDAGFEFTWEPAGQGTKVQLHRVGSQDNVIADAPPFEWVLPATGSAECFEARTVNAEETRMSQVAAGPVCAP